MNDDIKDIDGMIEKFGAETSFKMAVLRIALLEYDIRILKKKIVSEAERANDCIKDLMRGIYENKIDWESAQDVVMTYYPEIEDKQCG